MCERSRALLCICRWRRLLVVLCTAARISHAYLVCKTTSCARNHVEKGIFVESTDLRHDYCQCSVCRKNHVSIFSARSFLTPRQMWSSDKSIVSLSSSSSNKNCRYGWSLFVIRNVFIHSLEAWTQINSERNWIEIGKTEVENGGVAVERWLSSRNGEPFCGSSGQIRTIFSKSVCWR